MGSEVQVPEKFQYLRPSQIRELEQERKNLRKQIEDPRPGGSDKGDMARRARQIDKMLDEQSPPDLSPSERESYSKEAKRLEEQFTQGMPSAEEMRKNPPGAVDKHLLWQRRNTRLISRWKNVIRALHKGDESPNIANVERFRKHDTIHDLPMDNAQIPGKSFFGTNPSPEFKEGWERTFGAESNAEVQALQERIRELEQEKLALTQRRTPKKSRTPKETLPAKCGKMVDSRSVRRHERLCNQCKAISDPAAA